MDAGPEGMNAEPDHGGDSVRGIGPEMPAEPTRPERHYHLAKVTEDAANAGDDGGLSEHESETESRTESVQNEPELVLSQ